MCIISDVMPDALLLVLASGLQAAKGSSSPLMQVSLGV